MHGRGDGCAGAALLPQTIAHGHPYPQDAQANIVERSYISGVAEIRGGAHPSSLPPAYGWDMKAFKAYADAAKDPGDWSAVADRFVGASEDEYIAGFGGTDAVTKLPLPVF